MKNKSKISLGVSICLLLLFATVPVALVSAATEEEINLAIETGMAWLADQQLEDGSWQGVARTGFAVVKFETHAKRIGKDPLDPTYQYYDQVRDGLDYIFLNAWTEPIGVQTHGDPDTRDNDIGVWFGWEGYSTYETGIAMMAIAESCHPEMAVNVVGSSVDGWTYLEVLQDAVDYLAWGQTDSGDCRGGWNYEPSDNFGGRSDNSNTGYAVLGLAYAETFGCTIPAFVKDELSLWIDWIQNDVDGDVNDGGSGYDQRGDAFWVNTLKTGNLLFEMAFCGDTISVQRVIDAVDYIDRHWYAADYTPGWIGPGPEVPPGQSNYRPGWPDWPACYQSMYCIMKGFEILGIEYISPLNDIAGIDWFDEMSTVLVDQQNGDGSWPNAPLFGSPEDFGEGPPGSPWSWDFNQILSTEWALLTLQKAVPPTWSATKTLDPTDVGLGDVVHVTVTVTVPSGETAKVVDTLPEGFQYLFGTFMVDGVPATPTIDDHEITYIITESGAHVIEFDVIVDSVEAAPYTATNWVHIYDVEDTLVAEASADITINPYCGFHKVACLVSAGDDMYIDLFENVIWEFRITVTNLFDWTMTDVVVTDRLGAELEIDDFVYIWSPEYEDDWGQLTAETKGNVKLTWTIGDLGPGETATLILEISTNLNPKGKQRYTSCDWYELNSGATLKFLNPCGIQLSAHTGQMVFEVPGEWPHFQPYCVRYPETGNVYIGYEDWSNGDFDYNDFGMTFSMEEIYDENWNLYKVTMKFTAIIYDSGMDHLIHIERPIVGDSIYTVTRSVPAYPNELTLWDGTTGKETPAGTYPGTGDVDVVLFNTQKYPQPSKQINEVVTIEIFVVDPSLNPKGIGPYPYREYSWGFDYDISIMTKYDPWEEGTLYECRFHIWDTQTPTSTTGQDPNLVGVELPFILVVPKTDWIPPFESTTITTPYPEFYDYYTTGSPIDWYENYSGTGRSWEP